MEENNFAAAASSSGERKTKKQKIEIDRFSRLPDPVIHQILSFIDIKEVVQTSVLSKTWRYTWKFPFQNLIFNHSGWKKVTVDPLGRAAARKLGFVNFIDQVLRLPDISNVEKLSLNCGPYCDEEKIEQWIRFAVEQHVKEVDLEAESAHLLPGVMFKRDVTKFKLHSLEKGYMVLPKSLRSSAQLRTLELVKARLPDGNDRNKLILKCPVLEILIMNECDHHDLGVISIATPQLKTLVISNESKNQCVDYCKLKISAPNLTSFTLHGSSYKDYVVNDLLSLVSANIRVTGGCTRGGRARRPREEHLVNVLKGIYNVTTLELSNSWFVVPISQDLLDQLPHPFSNLLCLKLTWSEKSCTRVISDLLKSSHIETLVLQANKANAAEEYSREDFLIQSMLCHLKFVEIQHFIGSKVEHEFLKTILDNAILLEKVTFGLSRHLLSNEQKEAARICQWLLSLPRASSKMKICFSDLNTEGGKNHVAGENGVGASNELRESGDLGMPFRAS